MLEIFPLGPCHSLAEAFGEQKFIAWILNTLFLLFSSGFEGQGQHKEHWKKVCVWKASGAQAPNPATCTLPGLDN